LNIRPYAIECLHKLAKHFELIVFTASHQFYAESVLELIDPKNELFSHKLFRPNCIKTDNGLYIKDLRILTNRNLENVIIVDNSIISFAFQLDNGVPILPYFDDKDDKEMLKITDYLMSLKDVTDIRIKNKEEFEMNRMSRLDICRFLKYYSEEENNTDSSFDSFDSSFESFDKGETKKNEFSGIRRKAKRIVENELRQFKENFSAALAKEVTEIKLQSPVKEKELSESL